MKLQTQKILVFILFLCFSSNTLFSQQRVDADKVAWFKDAKFGMFIHWGLYSILAGSYNGHTLPDESFKEGKSWYAEWVQKRLEVPDAEYQALAKTFDPINFDADAWIKEAKNAGMRYFVITSKHHDGFALWDSKYSDFNIMNTPYKKDILEQLVKACKKYGMKYGFYYSHWQDWEHPGGALPEWEVQRSDAQFETYWCQKCLPQVKELIEKFDPDMFWFDTWGTEEVHITTARRDELIKLVRDNSSKCLINGRISYANPSDDVDFMEMMDNGYPDKIQEKPWQTPATMTHSWGWHANDFNWKPSTQMLGYLVNNTSKGGNYLLNIGPKSDGTFPVPAVRRLREMGAWLYANGESIYSAQHVNIEIPNDRGIFLTQKESQGKNCLYISLTKAVDTVELPIASDNLIYGARILETGQPIVFSHGDGNAVFTVPQSIFKDASIQVIKVELSYGLN